VKDKRRWAERNMSGRGGERVSAKLTRYKRDQGSMAICSQKKTPAAHLAVWARWEKKARKNRLGQRAWFV
jgi:hypothetical protein